MLLLFIHDRLAYQPCLQHRHDIAVAVGTFWLFDSFHLKVKAEHTPEHANYKMLQELRKLNALQRQQAEEAKGTEKAKPVNIAEKALSDYRSERKRLSQEHSRKMAESRREGEQISQKLARLKQEREQAQQALASKPKVYTDVAEDPEIWEGWAALKAERAAAGQADLVAQMEADEAQFWASNPEIKAKLDANLALTKQAATIPPPLLPRSTPPPLPPVS